MTTENSGDEVKAQGIATPEADSSSPQAEPVESLRQKLTEYEQKLTEESAAKLRLEAEAKAHQRVASKKAEEAQKWQRLAESLAEDADKGTGDYEEEARPAKGKYRQQVEQAKRQTADEEQAKAKAEYDRKVVKAETMAEIAGLDIASAPALEVVRLAFNAGEPDRGLAELKKVVDLKKQPKEKEVVNQPENKATENDLREKIKREVMVEYGLLKPEANLPSGGGATYTRSQIARMSVDEYAQNKAEIDKAEREGRIK